MPKAPRHVAEIALIVERVGDRPFCHADIADLAGRTNLAGLRGEGLIEVVERKYRATTWRVTDFALERYRRPMILAENGDRQPVSGEEAVLLCVWQAAGESEFTTADFPTMRPSSSFLQRKGLVEKGGAPRIWRVTPAGAAYAADLARRVREAGPAPSGPVEASA